MARDYKKEYQRDLEKGKSGPNSAHMNVNVLAACLTKLVQIKIKMERQTPERAKTLTMSHQYVKVANQFVTTCVLEVK
jgi:hypothetical protein